MILYGSTIPSPLVQDPEYLQEMRAEGVLEYASANGRWAFSGPESVVTYDTVIPADLVCTQTFDDAGDGDRRFDEHVATIATNVSAVTRPDLGPYRTDGLEWWHGVEVQLFGDNVVADVTIRMVGDSGETIDVELMCTDDLDHDDDSTSDRTVIRRLTGLGDVDYIQVWTSQVCVLVGDSADEGHLERLEVRLSRYGGVIPTADDADRRPAGLDHPYLGGDLVCVGERDPGPTSTQGDDVLFWGEERSTGGVEALPDRTTQFQWRGVSGQGDYAPWDGPSDFVQAVVCEGEFSYQPIASGASMSASSVSLVVAAVAFRPSLSVVDSPILTIQGQSGEPWVRVEVDGGDVTATAMTTTETLEVGASSQWYDLLVMCDPATQAAYVWWDGELTVIEDYAPDESVRPLIGSEEAPLRGWLAMPYACAQTRVDLADQWTEIAGYFASYRAYRRMMMEAE